MHSKMQQAFWKEIVVQRAVGRVAGIAFDDVPVIVDYFLPVDGRVAVRALTGVMVVRIVILQVAGQAVGKAGVVKGDILPVGRAGVATGASVRVFVRKPRSGLLACRTPCHRRRSQQVIIWNHIVVGRGVWLVAGVARDYMGMIVRCFFPVGGVGVADDACMGIVVLWVFLQVAGLAFDDVRVIEFKRLPVVNDVAVATIAGEMVGIERVGRQLVAMTTVNGGIGVLTVPVAGSTFKVGVSLGKGIVAVINILAEEGDRYGLRQRGRGRHWRYDSLTGVGLLQGGDLAAEGGCGLVVGRIVPGRFQRRQHRFGLLEEFLQTAGQFALYGGRGGVYTPGGLVQGPVKGGRGHVDLLLPPGLSQVGQAALRQLKRHVCLAYLARHETQAPLLGRQLRAVEGVTRSKGTDLRHKDQATHRDQEQQIDDGEQGEYLFHLLPIIDDCPTPVCFVIDYECL